MPLDFSGKNLQGRSFQGQDLTGAQFRHAIVTGANFADAILISADFTGATAGLRMRWSFVLHFFVLLLVIISGAATRLAGGIAAAYAPGQAVTLTALILSFIFIAKRGIAAQFATLVTVLAGSLILMGVGAGVLSFFNLIPGGLDANVNFVQRLAWALAGTFPWAIAAVLSIALAGNLIWILTRTRSLLWTKVLLLGVLGSAVWSQFAIFFQPDQNAWTVNSVAIAVLLLSIHLGQRSFQEHEHFAVLRRLAVAIAAQGGTSFRGANLTTANFAYATLKGVNFKAALLTRTHFHTAKHLDQARVDHTILTQPIVRDLLVTHRGAQRSYHNCDLSGANLVGADLRMADLTDANLCHATLEDAELQGANLTRVQALWTNLQRSQLTGACLESWNIDRTTKLDQVQCEYVYLLRSQQERRPRSGSFAANEFTKLFQVVIDTVDLIFQAGVDWKAFMATFRTIQVQHEDLELTVRSIENTEDGVVVIKVNAPESADKTALHAEFTQTYETLLRSLEQRYQSELQAKDEQIVLYQQQQADLKQVMQWFSAHAAAPTPQRSSKRVVLKLNQGDFKTGFVVTLQIGFNDALPHVEMTGQLPPAPDLAIAHRQWQSVYRKSLEPYRIKLSETQITHISDREFFKDCHDHAEHLKHQVNDWLNSNVFRAVKETLLEQLSPTESIQIILQTEHQQLRQMPLQLWDFFDRYPKAEIVLGTTAYQTIQTVPHSPLTIPFQSTNLKILAVLGDSTGIDLRQDQTLLQQLPHAEVTFLVEPQRQVLNDHLWSQSWNILFFAGHSSTRADAKTGEILINPTESLTMTELKHGLRHAIDHGLQLAIFNSCDGLGLATELADLQLAHMIVMREPIPDPVAQEFLKNFLAAFVAGKPLHRAVREARERLQGLEHQFPCATWLPVVCQNPATPIATWRSLTMQNRNS